MVPPLIQSTRDWVQNGGGGESNTDIKQMSDAVTPAFDSPYVEMLIKSRIDTSIDGDVALLLSEAYFDGELDLSPLGLTNASVATTFTTLKQINSYAIGGKAREELVQVLSATASRTFSRMRGMFRRGGSYEGGGGFSDAG